jgi:hypothetical protein
VVFIRRRLQFSVVSIYLVWLAVADTGNLLMALRQWLYSGLFYITNTKINIPSGFSQIDCMFKIYFWNVFVFTSASVIIMYSIERSIAVWFPLKVWTLVTPRRRRVALALSQLVPIVSYSPIFASYSTTVIGVDGVNRLVCVPMRPDKTTESSYQIFSSWIYLSSKILPTCVIVFINVMIVIGARRSHDKRSQMTSSNSLAKTGAMSRNLFLVSTIYLLTSLPEVIVYMIIDIKRKGTWQGMDDFAYLIELNSLTQNIGTTNYAINFVIYALSLKVFRRELVQIWMQFCRSSRI